MYFHVACVASCFVDDFFVRRVLAGVLPAFSCTAGMITHAVRHGAAPGRAPVSAAERLALLARHAGSDAEAIKAIEKALEEMLL